MLFANGVAVIQLPVLMFSNFDNGVAVVGFTGAAGPGAITWTVGATDRIFAADRVFQSIVATRVSPPQRIYAIQTG